MRETHRWYGIDALRGLAVVFMIEQHIIYWLCADLHDNKLVIVFGAMGGLAAPIFIMLSGFGSHMTGCRYQKSGQVLFSRGLMILGFAYLLNVLAPNWFSIGSWYILHLIGLLMLMSPILKRLSSATLIVLIVIILVSTVFIQTELGVPIRLYNQHMSNTSGFGDFFRHLMVEGFFPLFPWSSFFVAGFLASRWFSAMKPAKIYYLSFIFFVMSLILACIYTLGFEFTKSEYWIRLFTVTPSFYPSLTPISLFLISTTLFFIVSFVLMESRISFKSSNALVCLGRSSLTFLILHVVIIRESAVRFHFRKSFSVPETFLITLCFLLLFTLIAVAWRRINFKFGAEWLIRRVSSAKNKIPVC